MGATDPAEMQDIAATIAARFERQRVDTVPLPGLTICKRAVGALAHMIEQHGPPTVALGLFRPHMETIRPPRGLWLPLKRPSP